MRWQLKWWINKERKNLKGQDRKTQELVQKMLATLPVRDYLISLMDEVVRQGIFLSSEKQQGALYTLDLLKKEIEKGDIVIEKENKQRDRN